MADKPRINLVTLGCAKNLVDSEYLAKQLEVNGFSVKHEFPDNKDVVIINTCGFINDAKKESLDTIFKFIEAKKEGSIQHLFVMGCLSQRYKTELNEDIPEVDGFFGVEDHHKILSKLKASYDQNYDSSRKIATPDHYAYLKIAEGCNRKCSFCAIPLIRGSYKSKPIEKLTEEAITLSKSNVKEINLIAQDLSYYGYDLYNKSALSDLLKKLVDLKKFHWIRLLYFYPTNFPIEVLDLMRDNKEICNYLDIPFQHITDKMLKYMRRGINKEKTYSLIEHIKSRIPDVSLRTTLLVGHPGETEKDFEELLNFVREVRFDRLGVFTYSEEEDTFTANEFKDTIPEEIKKERADEIMKVQQEISLQKNQDKVNSIIELILEREDDDNYYGRSEADAPEVDNEIIIPKAGKKYRIGSFYNARIDEAWEYDLIGKIIEK